MSDQPTIDEQACIAQGDCVETASAVFALEDRAVVLGSGPDELLLAAAKGCPVQAITLVDPDTGEQVYP
ncbi:MAG TPA: ferredoxin [Solirubrobacteraceae bacterium]|nr:ferredoxin [Solirubrobacteraceae bacterium]